MKVQIVDMSSLSFLLNPDVTQGSNRSFLLSRDVTQGRHRESALNILHPTTSDQCIMNRTAISPALRDEGIKVWSKISNGLPLQPSIHPEKGVTTITHSQDNSGGEESLDTRKNLYSESGPKVYLAGYMQS